jgi:hypothetical protein
MMPPRKRFSKQRYTVTLDVLGAAMDLRGWEEYWGGSEQARRAWEALGDEMVLAINPGRRPAVWWHYTDGVPPELQREPVTVDDDICLTRQRCAFLLEHSEHLHEGEGAILQREMERGQ